MIPRQQYGRSMAINTSRYVSADPFHEWQDAMLQAAAEAGVPWGALIQTLDEKDVPPCASDFYRAYKRPAKPPKNPRPTGKDRPR